MESETQLYSSPKFQFANPEEEVTVRHQRQLAGDNLLQSLCGPRETECLPPPSSQKLMKYWAKRSSTPSLRDLCVEITQYYLDLPVIKLNGNIGVEDTMPSIITEDLQRRLWKRCLAQMIMEKYRQKSIYITFRPGPEANKRTGRLSPQLANSIFSIVEKAFPASRAYEALGDDEDEAQLKSSLTDAYRHMLSESLQLFFLEFGPDIPDPPTVTSSSC
ncbi:hypothetical protein SISSUDRAFT_1035566 [Sistotremastrum suecicum HHB10207 ss-3]|uniref:Uncharacterized protein n=1 Tax=Sistotremastrum suecicum HHB10207 ss-3 TaxID=1314776 RepID=A0A166ALF8_9AGAM|nr:hypothetical protein SISSUDRAFT_1035566 [Sistotremastrum suecicum HHB10207 ss-3]